MQEKHDGASAPTQSELIEALRKCRNQLHCCITAPRGKQPGMDSWVADAACEQYDVLIRCAEGASNAR